MPSPYDGRNCRVPLSQHDTVGVNIAGRVWVVKDATRKPRASEAEGLRRPQDRAFDEDRRSGVVDLEAARMDSSIMDGSDILRLGTDFLASVAEIRLGLVYGSFANGKASEGSDVDIAIAGDDRFSADFLMQLRGDLELLFGRDVDLIDLARVEGLILHRAVTRSLTLKRDPVLFADYLCKALAFHEDFLPYLRRMRGAKIERFAHGS
jgi:predicted nucleotidyltransferase